jgi:prepilin-type N-terminal cleavage/methylation domain-containing protein
MKRNVGFTLAELLITMTIMVILLAIVIVNLRSNQANARDEQRKTDVAAIAQQLESYYEAGTATASPGTYPSTDLMGTEAQVDAALRDIDTAALRAPNVASSSPISLTVATTNSTTQTPNTSTFIYQPLQSDGTLCNSSTQSCRKFNIYYALETVSGTQSVASKNQ